MQTSEEIRKNLKDSIATIEDLLKSKQINQVPVSVKELESWKDLMSCVLKCHLDSSGEK